MFPFQKTNFNLELLKWGHSFTGISYSLSNQYINNSKHLQRGHSSFYILICNCVGGLGTFLYSYKDNLFLYRYWKLWKRNWYWIVCKMLMKTILNITLAELVLISISYTIRTMYLIADYVIRDNYQCGIFKNSSVRHKETLWSQNLPPANTGHKNSPKPFLLRFGSLLGRNLIHISVFLLSSGSTVNPC